MGPGLTQRRLEIATRQMLVRGTSVQMDFINVNIHKVHGTARHGTPLPGMTQKFRNESSCGQGRSWAAPVRERLEYEKSAQLINDLNLN